MQKNHFIILGILSLIFLAADFEVIITLEEPEINTSIDNAFRINNLDYYSGFEGENVFLNYSFNNQSWNTTKLVKKYSSSKTSNITFTNNYTQELCVNIFSEEDNNSENNLACKTFFEEKPVEIIEDCSTEFDLMQAKIFEEKAIIDYEVLEEEFELTYWIEDIYENIVKEKTSTNNDNKKQFTPKQAGAYFLFAELNVCNELIEKNTFFIVKKDYDNYLFAELKKENPLTFEFVTKSNEFVKKGIKINIISEEKTEEIFADLIQGEQNYNFDLGKVCGEQEIIIEAEELQQSFLLSLEECEEEFVPEAKISAIGNSKKIFVNIYNPFEEEFEIYVKKNNKKVGSAIFDSQEYSMYGFEVSEIGRYEVVANIGSETYTERVEVEGIIKEEIKEVNVVSADTNTPLITGNSINPIYKENSSVNWTFLAVLGVIIFLIGDKFLKNKHSRKIHEQKGDKS